MNLLWPIGHALETGLLIPVLCFCPVLSPGGGGAESGAEDHPGGAEE